MGFRNPLTTATDLDTGNTGQSVRITRTGGQQGGGAVELYPNGADSVPGLLEAGTDAEVGSYVALSSPPRLADGRRATLLLTEVDARVATPGPIYLDGASVQLPRGTGWVPLGVPAATLPFPGAGGLAIVSGLPAPTLHRDASGFVHGSGLAQDTIAGPTNRLIATLPAGYRPTNLAGLTIPGFSAGATALYPVNVLVNGEVRMQAATPAGIVYYLDHLIFPLAN